MNKYVIPESIGLVLLIVIIILVVVICLSKFNNIGANIKTSSKYVPYGLSLSFAVFFISLDFPAFGEIKSQLDQMNFWTGILGQAVIASWVVKSFKNLPSLRRTQKHKTQRHEETKMGRHFEVMYWGHNPDDETELTELRRAVTIPDETIAALKSGFAYSRMLYFICDDGEAWFLPARLLCEIREVNGFE